MPRKKIAEPTIAVCKQFGRPSKYSKELAELICDKLVEGKSLIRICREDGMPSTVTVYAWLKTNKEFLNKYSLAREIQADTLADEILDIADNGTNDYTEDKNGNRVVNYDHINRSKLRVTARMWYAAKVAPKKYGDRQAVEMSGLNGAPINPVQIYLPQKGSLEKDGKPI
jgi:hypothetical protein